MVKETCTHHILNDEYVLIGTSAMVDTELDSISNMYIGAFNNPYLHWGKIHDTDDGCTLPVSFQFHHVQMDGAHATRFLENLQKEIDRL